MVADDKHHRAIMSCHCFEKHTGAVIQCEDLKGLEVAPSAGSNMFGKITGEELLLGLPSEALTKMTVHALCRIIRVTRKDGVFGHLQAKIGSHLDKNPNAKALLDGILKHAPKINKKCHVPRLVFLARLLAVVRMESSLICCDGKGARCVRFEEDAGDEKCLKSKVVSSLNALKTACDKFEKKDKSKKQHREDTTIDDSIAIHVLPV
jgi:hypothetical protein